jgi:hypothetical protein
MSELPPYLGPPRPSGEGICVHTEHDGNWENVCGRKAVWHVMWTASGESSPCCNHHRHNCKFVQLAVQVHKLLPDCTMPGAVWYKDEGVCRWEPPMTDEPPMRRVEKELELVP